MKIVFRVDASIRVGSGHVMRCLVLADELSKLNCSINFACLPQQGDMISYIEDRGFQVIRLNAPNVAFTPSDDADYEAWLLRPIIEDAIDFIDLIKSAHVVITDHYAIGHEWQCIVRKELGCFIVALDDLVRKHDADLIIDQTLGRQEGEYLAKTRVLVGCEYAILAANFSALREQAQYRKEPKLKPRILISMGGIDNPNATLKVLEALEGKVTANFTVLLSARAPHYDVVKVWCSKHADVLHKDFEPNMASLMLQHDIAIGAPGTTSWERACLGLPSILIPLADNQKTICVQLLNHKAIIKVSLDAIHSQLLLAYQSIFAHWEDFSQANFKLCDGRGTRRIALEIQQLICPNKFSHLQLKSASHSDIKIVYEWQCHPRTRKYALTPESPKWPEHKQWMEQKLSSTKDYFYLIVDKNNGDKLGVFRLDNIQDGHYLVSIFIAPESYGKGVATAALLMADSIHPDVTLHATVKEANIASQKLFKKANYTQLTADTFIRNPI